MGQLAPFALGASRPDTIYMYVVFKLYSSSGPTCEQTEVDAEQFIDP